MKKMKKEGNNETKAKFLITNVNNPGGLKDQQTSHDKVSV